MRMHPFRFALSVSSAILLTVVSSAQAERAPNGTRSAPKLSPDEIFETCLTSCADAARQKITFTDEQFADCIERGFGQTYCERWKSCITFEQKMNSADCLGNCHAARSVSCYEEYEDARKSGRPISEVDAILNYCAVRDSYAGKLFESAQSLFDAFSASCGGVPLSPILWGTDL